MFKRKLFKRALSKRALPFILSVAMVFESMPATALAAEAPETAQVVETAADGSADEADAGGSGEETRPQENADVPETPAAVESSALSESSAPAESSMPSESATPAEDATPSEGTAPAESTASAESAAQAEDPVPESDEEGEAEELQSADADAPTELPEAEIVVDAKQKFGAFTKKAGDAADTYTYEREYAEVGLFDDVIQEVSDALTIKVDDADDEALTELKGLIEYTYETSQDQQNWTPMDSVPTDAGSYSLKIFLKENNICKEKTVYINFVVKPKALEPECDAEAAAGGSIEAFVKELVKANEKEQWTFSAAVHMLDSDGKPSAEATTDKTFDSTKNYAVIVTAAVKEAYSKNYVVDAAAYYPVEVDAKLVDTAVKVERKEDNKAEVIVRTYDGTALLKKADIINTYVDEQTLKVTKGTGDDEETVLDYDAAVKEVVSAWYTREKIQQYVDETNPDKDYQWDGDENGTTTGKATYRYTLVRNDDGAVKDDLTEAGEYYLVYIYPGEEGRYKASDRVVLQAVIEPSTLTLEPAVFTLRTGMDAESVRKALAQAEYTLADDKGAKYPAEGELPEDFFGSAYGNGQTTQYFTPVFRLDMRIKWDDDYISGLKEGHDSDEEYTAWVDFTALSDYQWDNKWKELTGLDGSKAIQKKTADGRDIEYRIIFTGEKAVYDADGWKAESASVMDTTTLSADKNHKVKADTATLEEKARIVTVEDAEPVEINVDGILEKYKDSGAGTLESPAWKIYDGDPLFGSRADYKKATVTGVESSTDESITYTWQRLNSFNNYVAYLEADNEKAENGKTNKENAEKELLKEDAWSWYTIDEVEDSVYLVPTNADLYRLKIDYKDKNNEKQPATAYVYFGIKKQAVITVAGNQYAEYGSSSATGTYSIYKIENNDLNAFMESYKAGTVEPLDWKCSGVKWKTEIADGDNWSEIPQNVSFIEGETYQRYAYFDSFGSGPVKNSEDKTERNKNGNPLNWANFTNIQNYAFGTENKTYYNIPKKIEFGMGEIEFEVNASFIKDVVYNAKSATEGIAATDVIQLKDKATGAAPEGVTLGTAAEQGDSNTVNVYWIRSYGNETELVPFNEAVYGGTYTLVANFSGNDKYKSAYVYLSNEKSERYEFTIKPLEIGIAPILKEAPVAGKPVSELVDQEQIAITGTIPDADKGLFEYNPWNFRDEIEGEQTGWYEGYGILNGSYDWQLKGNRALFGNTSFYKDGEQTNDVYLRTGSEYFAKFDTDGQELYGNYQYSYKIIDNPSDALKVQERGESDVVAAPAFTNNDGWVDVIKTVEKEAGKNTKYTIIPREAIPFAYNNGYTVWTPDANTTAFEKDRNYLAFRIMVPREFYGEINEAEKNFIYKNSIIAAGGYSSNPERDDDNYYIKALFPVETEKDENGKDIIKAIDPFYITWEDGYTETFQIDLTNAVLESNLKNAVAPKSLAFNSVQAKMAVGESQQLDLKITKANLGDVIKINYRAVGNDADAISIDPETGIVTALKADKKAVTIEAYPVRLGDDGKTYEEITGKGVKIAKTKVTVTEVTAPAVKKIVSVDSTTIDVQYSPVKDGYRREIYVKEIPSDAAGKVDKAELKAWTNKKDNQFEKAIAEMTNGQWEAAGFAREPIYLSKTDENQPDNLDYEGGPCRYDAKLKLNVLRLTVPKPNTTYVVYVRNVSAARTLADGSKVALSAAGTMKNFVTVKSQVWGLIPWFEVANDDETDAENYNKPTVKNPVVYWTDNQNTLHDGTSKNDYNAKDRSKKNRIWTVDFVSAKSLQLMVDGEFDEKPSNPAAQYGDTIYRTLPIKKDKAMLADYVDPKLTYAVFDSEQDINDWNSNAKLINGKWVITNQSKYAAVKNGGKLTLKGVGADGEAVLYIYALADNGTYGYAELHVTARPTEVKGKKAKLKVGDQVRLATLLDYKEGKKKVPNYISTNITIKDTDKEAAEKAGFMLEQIWEENGRRLPNGETCARGEWLITVIKDGNYSLPITDKVFETAEAEKAEKTEETTVTLTGAMLDPVKGLKVAYVDDSRITVNFAHAGNPEAFNIEVTDAAGRVIFKRLVWNNMEATEGIAWDSGLKETTVYRSSDNGGYYDKLLVKANAKSYWQELQRSAITQDIADNDDASYDEAACLAYFEKTKNYAYTIMSEKLLRLSSYNITVTPVFGNEAAAKPAKTKAKTTNIPASYENLNVVAPEVYGGADITYNNGNISQYPYFVAGNTYTLTFGDNDYARDRVTDTLAWKSSNTKVASIKANAGSFTAALKAQQQGTTVITVTSKITKKIVARYLVAVRSIGNGRGYLGEHERGYYDFYDEIVFGYDPGYQGKLEVLTFSNPVVVDENYLYGAAGVEGMNGANDATWVQFTAPSYGQYTFSCDGGSNIKVYRTRKLEAGSGEGSALNGRSFTLEAGEKLYFRICGTFTLRAMGYTDFARLTIANDSPKNALAVARASWIAFTAPEDNCYTFKTVTDNKEENPAVTYTKTEFLKKGERTLIEITSKCYLYVEPMAKDAVELTVNEGNGVTVEFTKPEKDAEYPIEKWVKFTAPDSTYYQFDIDKTKLKGIENYVVIDFKNIRNTSVKDKGEVLAKAANKDSNREIFIEAGECVLIQFTVSDKTNYENAFKGDVEYSASVSVTSSEIKDLAVGTTTVPEEKVSIFKFKIPEGHSLYNVETKGGATIDNVRDNKLEQVKFEDAAGNPVALNNAFMFEVDADGKSTLNGAKAGDTVYVQVRNQNEKAAEIIVTAKSGTQTIALGETPFTLDDDFEEWYTFTAPETAWYKLETETTANDSYDTHEMVVKKYENGKIFTDADGEMVNSGDLMELQAGGTVVFKVTAQGSETTAGNTTEAKITISEVIVTPIKADAAEATPVNLDGKADDVTYYAFTPVDTTADYTLRWEFPEDRNKPEIAIASDLNGTYNAVGNGADNYSSLTGKCYIKVTQKTDKAVSGELSITSGKTTTKTLKLGVPTEITLEKKNDEQKFNFIASRALLGYRVEVANTTEPDELKNSSVYLNDNAFDTVDAGEAEYLDWTNENGMTTLTVKANSDNVTVKVTVTENVPENLDADKTIDVTGQTLKWYTYSIPTSGRYTWPAESGVTWKQVYYSQGNGTLSSATPDGYFTKGRRLYIQVKGESASETTKQVTIKMPEKVSDKLTYLMLDEPMKLVKNAYYGFKADEFGNYNIKGLSNDTLKYLEKNDIWSNNGELDKDEIVFFKAVYSGDKTVTVTKLPRSTVPVGTGDTDITDLENGEEATFTFVARKSGVYEVKAASENATVTTRGGTAFGPQTIANYKAVTLKAGEKLTVTVTNQAKGEETKASFKLSITELKAEPVSETPTVPKKSVVWYEYTTPEDGAGITITITKPGKNTDPAATTTPKAEEVKGTQYYTYDAKTNLYQPAVISKEAVKDRKFYFAIVNSEDADVTYTFKAAVTKKPENTVSFVGNEERTITYKVEKTGTYTFTAHSYDGGDFNAESDEFNGAFTNGKATTVILHAGDVMTVKVEQTSVSLGKDEGRHSLSYEIKLEKAVDVEVASGSPYEIKADDQAKDTDKLKDFIIEYTMEKAGDYAVEFEGGTVSMAGDGNKSFDEGLVPVDSGDMLVDSIVGDRVYFVVRDVKAKAGFRMSLNAVEAFAAGTTTATVTYPAAKYYKLTVEDDKVYELQNIDPTGDPAPTAATVQYSTIGWRADSFEPLQAKTVNEDGNGETIYLKVTGSQDKDGDNYKASTYTLKLTEYADFGTGQSGTIPKGETLFYMWKALATGAYTMETGDDPKVEIEVVVARNKDNETVGNPTMTDQTQYNKGDKVYFKVTATDPAAEAAYNLKMVQFVPEVSADGTFSGNVEKDKSKTYEWTVTRSGDYVMEYTGKAGIVVSKNGNAIGNPINQATGDTEEVLTKDAFDDVSFKLKRDDIITVEASNAGSETALAYNLSIKPITYAAVEEKEYTLQPGRYAYYKYTSSREENEVTKTGENVVFNEKNRTNDGKVKYYRAENTADPSAEVKYTLSIDAIKNLGEAPSGTVAKGRTVRLEYTADAEGQYLLTYEGKAAVTVDEEEIASESSEGTKVVREYYLADEPLRIAVTNENSETALDYKLSVVKVSYEDLKTNTEIKDKEIDNTDIHYYKFTAAKGRYVLRFTGLDNVSIQYAVTEADFNGYEVSDPFNFNPEAGDNNIYLRVEKKDKTNSDKVKYSLVVKTYESLTADQPVDGTFAANADAYAFYKFTSPATGQYIIEHSGEGTYTVNGESGSAAVLSECVQLDRGQTKYFMVRKTDAADKEVKYNLVVKNYTSVTGNEAGGELEAGKTAYFKYTFNEVNEDAEYVLETKGTVSWSENPCEDGWRTVTDATSIGDIRPDRGDTLYFKAENNTTEKAEYKLALAAYTYKDVKPGDTEAGEVGKGKYVLLKYTPAGTGDYIVTIPTEGVTASIDGRRGAVTLTEGTTYKWIISHNPADADNASKYSITLTAVERTELTNGEKTDIKFTAETSGTQYYSYTIPADGQYVIEKSTGLYSVGIRVDGADASFDVSSSLYLKKGQVMDLSVNGSVSDAAYTLKVKREQSIPLTDGEAKEQKIASQEIISFSCPITEGGSYAVEASEGLTYYYRVVDTISDKDTTWRSLSSTTLSLTAGKSLYIRAYNSGTEENTCTVKVTSPSKQKENADKEKPAEG